MTDSTPGFAQRAEPWLQEGNAIYLYNLSSKLWRPVLQVVPVDGKHSVVAAEPAILSSQSPFQEVKNEDSRLICPAYEFNAKLFAGVAFVQRDLEAVLPRGRGGGGGGGGGLGVAVRAAPEAPLSQHGEVQHRARLRQHSSSVVVGHVADVKAIHLKKKEKKDQNTVLTYLIVPHYGHEVLFKVNTKVSAKFQKTYPELFCKPTLAAQSTNLFPTKVTTSL